MSLNQIFIATATVMFAIAFLIAGEVVTSNDGDAWLTAGLTFFCLGHLSLTRSP